MRSKAKWNVVIYLLAFLEYDILKCWHKLKTPFAVVNIFVIWKKRHLTEKIILHLTLLYIEITCQEDNLIKSKSFI
jgi:hypothetical protein